MIYFSCPDNNSPIGGIRILYRNVDILNKYRLDACILHSQSGFRITWFENETKVRWDMIGADPSKDIVVIPEVYNFDSFPGFKKVVYNQNYWYGIKPCDNPEIKAIVCVSEHNRYLIQAQWPDKPVFKIQWSIPSKTYYYNGTPKKNIICYSRAKNVDHVDQVLSKVDLTGWEVKTLSGSDDDVANLMRKSKIFLATGDKEGCARPPAEAMACGCCVVGYNAYGANEYMTMEKSMKNSEIIEYKNIEKFYEKLQWYIDFYNNRKDNNIGIIGLSDWLLEEYSEANEEQSVKEAWDKIREIVNE